MTDPLTFSENTIPAPNSATDIDSKIETCMGIADKMASAAMWSGYYSDGSEYKQKASDECDAAREELRAELEKFKS